MTKFFKMGHFCPYKMCKNGTGGNLGPKVFQDQDPHALGHQEQGREGHVELQQGQRLSYSCKLSVRKDYKIGNEVLEPNLRFMV